MRGSGSGPGVRTSKAGGHFGSGPSSLWSCYPSTRTEGPSFETSSFQASLRAMRVASSSGANRACRRHLVLSVADMCQALHPIFGDMNVLACSLFFDQDGRCIYHAFSEQQGVWKIFKNCTNSAPASPTLGTPLQELLCHKPEHIFLRTAKGTTLI